VLDGGDRGEVTALEGVGWDLEELVVSTGLNSATVGPGARRDALMAAGRWRDLHRAQERSVHAPAPTLTTSSGSAWQVHPPGARGG
jgi:hypothetical protein